MTSGNGVNDGRQWPSGAASDQFGPQPIEATSGTSRSIACSIRSRTSSAAASTAVFRHLEHELVVDRQEHVAVRARACSRSARSTSIIAILNTSEAPPWIGAFSA